MKSPFHRRHQVLLKIPVELAELGDGAAEICIAVLVVERGRNDDDRRDLSVFDQMIKHVFCGGIFKVFACVSAPAVHQINDVVSGFFIVFVIAVRRINVGRFCDRRLVSDIIL